MANINDILRAIPVKNRLTDQSVTIIHDSQPVTWGPGETRHLPNQNYAEWFRAKSLYQLDSRTYKHKYKLCIMGAGHDESDLTIDDLPPIEDSIIDWQNRAYADPKTGKTFRRVAVPTNGIPVMEPRADRADMELAAKQTEHAALVDAAVEKLAEFTPEQVAEGLHELTLPVHV